MQHLPKKRQRSNLPIDRILQLSSSLEMCGPSQDDILHVREFTGTGYLLWTTPAVARYDTPLITYLLNTKRPGEWRYILGEDGRVIVVDNTPHLPTTTTTPPAPQDTPSSITKVLIWKKKDDYVPTNTQTNTPLHST